MSRNSVTAFLDWLLWASLVVVETVGKLYNIRRFSRKVMKS
jgi:hypothetical protein